ncbi:hypothetical protein [Exiguobacterium sp. s22]|uniref:hypothetical protein n=1 Tax=Exiguobacterium sp. s22 TaxID=2751272 RepID=UPI001BEA4987|nr:hypothetical protein [Exiguobacterium sp. s22]
MNKQERLHTIQQSNRKRLLQRLFLALPAGLAVYFLMRTDGNIWIGFAIIGGVLLATRYFFSNEAEAISQLSEQEQVKRVVTLQYHLDFLFITLLALVNPLAIRIMEWSWIPAVLIGGALLYILWAKEKLDQQIRWLDPEQPTRREIRRF